MHYLRLYQVVAPDIRLRRIAATSTAKQSKSGELVLQALSVFVELCADTPQLHQHKPVRPFPAQSKFLPKRFDLALFCRICGCWLRVRKCLQDFGEDVGYLAS